MPTPLREDAFRIWNTGVDSVRARQLVASSIQCNQKQLIIGQSTFDAADFDRVIVVGGGKAGTAMAEGLMDRIGHWRPTHGWLNVPEGTEKDLGPIRTHPARPSGLNEPTPAGVEGSLKILDLVSNATPRDLCIALISGGGSALMPAPIPSITLEDKIRLTRFLSSAGADIIELNTVRKHLSVLKGGGLLRACNAKKLITLILSDVLGDPLDQIASGPTVVDTTTFQDVEEVLQKYDPQKCLPERIYQAIALQKQANLPPPHHEQTNTPDRIPTNETVVIGNNLTAVLSAETEALKLGYATQAKSSTSSEGTAEEVGKELAEIAIGQVRNDFPRKKSILFDQPSPPDCSDHEENQRCSLISGGEPTVVLCPSDQRGLGGRNQQVILAAYLRLLEAGLSESDWSRICILSGGTDGEDGPTNAAGAILDHHVHQKALVSKLDPADYLLRNDAYHFFQHSDGLLLTGPTGTNVCDVRVMLIDSKPTSQ